MSKAVSQYENGKLIAKYYSISFASYLTDVQQAHIGKVAMGKRNSAGGYKWKYNGNFNARLTPSTKGITQLDSDGEAMAVFANSSVASELTGIKESTIKAAVGKNKSAGGYLWS